MCDGDRDFVSIPIFGGMFMLTIDSTKPINRELFEEKMVKTGYIYIDSYKYKKTAAKYKASSMSKEFEVKFKMQLYTKLHSPFLDVNRENVIKVLDELGAPMGRLCDYNGKFSLAIDTKVKPMYLAIKNGEVKVPNKEKILDFLETFIDYKRTSSKTHGASKKLGEVFQPSDDVNLAGRKLSRIYFDLNQRVTGRYYTSNDNVQGYALEYVKAFTVPEGRFLVSIDFAQIDLRVAINLWLKSSENAHIFDSCEDKYEALARAIEESAGRTFDLNAFKVNRPQYKEMALATMYGSKSMGARTGDSEVVRILEEFYNKCEKLKTISFIGKSLWNGQHDVIMEDYFGFPRYLSYDEIIAEESGNSEAAKINNANSKLINTPVQTTSASIMPAVTLAIIDRFKELGYTDDDVMIYLNRHDEIIFNLSEKVKKDLWVFKDYETVIIDDWDPLKLEVEFYDYYKVPNKQYEEEYEKSWKSKLGERLEKQTPKLPTTRKAKNYEPIGKMFCVIKSHEDSYLKMLNKFCKSINVLNRVQTTGDYEQDFSMNSDVLSYISKEHPKFFECYEFLENLGKMLIVVDVNRGLASKSFSDKGMEEIIGLLESDITYVYDLNGNQVSGSGVFNRTMADVSIVEVIKTIDSHCVNPNLYYSLNRNYIYNKFY